MLNNLILSLSTYKYSDTAAILGSGKSINSISCDAWAKIIISCDTWAVNNWVYHPYVVPDFYMFETKAYAYDLLKKRLKEKSYEYRSTKFLVPHNKLIKGRPLIDVIPSGHYAFEVPQKRRGDRADARYTADYPFCTNLLTKSYDMSVTVLFELLYRLGYKRVVTFGIDLNDSLYFWSSGHTKYGEVHHLWNKQHEDRDPCSPHSTYRIKEFIDDFNTRHFIPNGNEIFVGHKNTALFPDLRYCNLTVE